VRSIDGIYPATTPFIPSGSGAARFAAWRTSRSEPSASIATTAMLQDGAQAVGFYVLHKSRTLDGR
jgi:hypothetical protein